MGRKHAKIKYPVSGGPFTNDARVKFLAGRPEPKRKSKHGQRGAAISRACGWFKGIGTIEGDER